MYVGKVHGRRLRQGRSRHPRGRPAAGGEKARTVYSANAPIARSSSTASGTLPPGHPTRARDRYGQTDDARGGLLVVDGVPALTGRRRVRQQGGYGREGALAEGGQGVAAQPVLDHRGVECRQERLAGGGAVRRNPATGPPWTGSDHPVPPACARGRTPTRRGLGQPRVRAGSLTDSGRPSAAAKVSRIATARVTAGATLPGSPALTTHTSPTYSTLAWCLSDSAATTPWPRSSAPPSPDRSAPVPARAGPIPGALIPP